MKTTLLDEPVDRFNKVITNFTNEIGAIVFLAIILIVAGIILYNKLSKKQ